jgi:hypothetical protein
MSDSIRALLTSLGFVSTCTSCMGQHIETNSALWYPYAFQFENCIVEVKFPVGAVTYRELPERFVPSGNQWDQVAVFVYDNERFFLNIDLRKYPHAPKPFQTYDDFLSHLGFKEELRATIRNSSTRDWIYVYSPPKQFDERVFNGASERNFYPLTPTYALVIGAIYSGKNAEDSQPNDSRRAIAREWLASVKISGCGYYEKDLP